MKHLKTITLMTIFFGIIVFILTILDFTALHDVQKDYVSLHILNHLGITLSDDLPEWTSTNGEWHILTVSFFLRSLFFILNTALLVFIYKKILLEKTTPHQPSTN